jgi:hypothetical protein
MEPTQIPKGIKDTPANMKNQEGLEKNVEIAEEKIELTDFRNEYDISSSKLRMIIRDLGLMIERIYDKQYIVGENPHNVSNLFYLKHAVLEYKATGYYKKTLEGKWYDIEQGWLDYTEQYNTPESRVKHDKKKEEKHLSITTHKKDIVPVRETSIERIETNLNIEKIDNKEIEIQIKEIIFDILNSKLSQEIPKKNEDILYTQNKLLEVEEKGFVITTEQVGNLLGMSKATIGSKPAEFMKLGFIFTKVKEGNATYWSVARYNVKKNIGKEDNLI